MLVSRGVPLLKTVKLLAINSNKCLKPSIRNSHVWSYRRCGPPASKRLVFISEVIQGLAWWWVLWHLCTEYEHITGEFTYPDPHKWTDEELGIPPQ